MKKKLSAAAWGKLDDAMKALYSLVGKDYILQLEDDEDDEPGANEPAGSKLALERKHRKAAEKARDDAVAALEALQEEKATATNDTKKMTDAHAKKVAKLEGERDAAILQHKDYVGGKLVSDAATDIAGKITKSPKIIMPHLLARLTVDHTGDEPTLVVLDAKGKASTATLDDLTKEFRDNKEFAGIVVASQASGGGASRPGVTAPVGSAPASGSSPQVQTAANLSKLSPTDLVGQVKARQAERAAAAQARQQESAA